MEQVLLGLRAHEVAGQSDGQLLRLFLGQGDQAAFAALVHRHGPTVLGVCRRILHNAADADDAFQATFLVLVRKAAALRSRAVLGGWLHSVARRTALKARGAAVRRSAVEQTMARPEAQGERARDDWLPFLDDELSCLPEKYRLPIILCDLEGRTRQEAAKHLGWPEGTVAGRLARGRTMLSKRLLRRGITFSAGALRAALPTGAAKASVPAALMSSTIKAATLVAAGQTAAEGVLSAKVAALTGEVMKAMLLTKLKIGAAVLVAFVLGGSAWLGYRSFAEEPAALIQRVDKKKAADKTSGANKPVAKAVTDEPKKVSMERVTPRDLRDRLNMALDMRDFQNPMTLKDALGLIYEKYKVEHSTELPLLIDTNAFKEDMGDAADIYDSTARFPPYPRKMTGTEILGWLLYQIPTKNAALVVRNGCIWITTQKNASLAHLLQEKVIANYENRPMAEVVQDLADMTGVSIALDPRAHEQTERRISVTFGNDVTLRSALRIVVDMVGLKLVDMQPGLYITTPSNAKELEKELREMKK